jgi:hypothetical protein
MFARGLGAHEGLRGPFAGDLLGCQRGVPRESPEGVPVGSVEMGAGPVAVAPDIGDARHADRAYDLRHSAAAPGVGVQHFLPQRREVGDPARLPEIFAGDLRLEHQAGLGHGPEQRVERLARLEIERAVLDLDDHVFGELPVQ